MSHGIDYMREGVTRYTHVNMTNMVTCAWTGKSKHVVEPSGAASPPPLWFSCRSALSNRCRKQKAAALAQVFKYT